MTMFQRHGYDNPHEVSLDWVAAMIEHGRMSGTSPHARETRLQALRRLIDIDRGELPETKRELYDEYLAFVRHVSQDS